MFFIEFYTAVDLLLLLLLLLLQDDHHQTACHTQALDSPLRRRDARVIAFRAGEPEIRLVIYFLLIYFLFFDERLSSPSPLPLSPSLYPSP